MSGATGTSTALRVSRTVSHVMDCVASCFGLQATWFQFHQATLICLICDCYLLQLSRLGDGLSGFHSGHVLVYMLPTWLV